MEFYIKNKKFENKLLIPEASSQTKAHTPPFLFY